MIAQGHPDLPKDGKQSSPNRITPESHRPASSPGNVVIRILQRERHSAQSLIIKRTVLLWGDGCSPYWSVSWMRLASRWVWLWKRAWKQPFADQMRNWPMGDHGDYLPTRRRQGTTSGHNTSQKLGSWHGCLMVPRTIPLPPLYLLRLSALSTFI